MPQDIKFLYYKGKKLKSEMIEDLYIFQNYIIPTTLFSIICYSPIK